MIAWLLTTAAFAVDMHVCVDVDTLLYDVYDPYAPPEAIALYDMPTSPVDDIWSSAGERPFRGGRIRYRQWFADAWSYDWLSDGSDGEQVGCRLLTGLTHGAWYSLDVISKADVGGNKVTVNPASNRSAVYLASTTFVTPFTGTGTFDHTVSGDAIQMAALLAFALHREDAGLQGLDLHVNWRLNGSDGNEWIPHGALTIPSGWTECWEDLPGQAEPGDMCVMGRAGRYKYILTHELGHMLLMAALPVPFIDYSYSLDSVGNCPEIAGPDDHSLHEMYSLEWNSGAWSEGFAHAYAAQTWNHYQSATADCGFYYYKDMDPDHDGILENPRVVECGGGFTASTDTFGPANYFDDRGCYQGGNSYTNSATEYDWLRTYWDLLAERQIPFDDLFDIAVDAGPSDWVAAGNVGHADWPSRRLMDAAACYQSGTHQSAIEAEMVEHGVARGLAGITGTCP